MTAALAYIAAFVLGALAGLHLYWAAGGRWGRGVVLPSRSDDDMDLFEPTPFATVVVAAVLLVSVTLLILAARPNLLQGVAGVAVALLGLVFLARCIGDFRWLGLFKRERSTRFAWFDTRVYVPLCAMLSLACFIVAWGAWA